MRNDSVKTGPADRAATAGVGLSAGSSEAPGITIFGLRISWALLFGTFPIYIGLVVIWIYFYSQTNGTYLSARNISNAVQAYSFKPVLALGIVLVLLLGEIDLSVGYLTSLAAAIFASFSYINGWPAAPSIIMTVLICTGLGAIQGLLVAWVRMPPSL